MSDSVDELIRGMPSLLDATKAAGQSAAAHFHITGDGGADYTVVVKEGVCEVMLGLIGEASCDVTLSAETYIGIATEKTQAEMAFMMGKIRTDHVPELIRFMGYFRRH